MEVHQGSGGYCSSTQSAYNSLVNALKKAKELHPENDPMTQIFLSISKNGQLAFEAKETGLAGVFQRVSIRSINQEMKKRVQTFLGGSSLGDSQLVALNNATNTIFNHVLGRRESKLDLGIRMNSRTTIETVLQKMSIKEIDEFLKKKYIVLPKTIRHTNQESIQNLLTSQKGESFSARINRIVEDLCLSIDKENLNAIKDELTRQQHNNVLATKLLLKIENQSVASSSTQKILLQKECLFEEAKQAYKKLRDEGFVQKEPFFYTPQESSAEYCERLVNQLLIDTKKHFVFGQHGLGHIRDNALVTVYMNRRTSESQAGVTQMAQVSKTMREETRLDPTEFPDEKAIERMSPEDVEEYFNSISSSRDPLQFLAKVSVVARRIGLDSDERRERKLFTKIVELWARKNGINPLHVLPEADVEALSQKLVDDLFPKVQLYTKEKNILHGLESMMKAAFKSWRMIIQLMRDSQ